MNKDKSQNLFSDEEMNNIIPGTMQFQQDQPVTCLGKEFPNDEARREYFREELRKKLPELRQIEGFPIGEDDDIINLSDPPYYTACPNPWLNDFITEWEKEKEQLLKEGKRSLDFEITEPYASDVSEGKNNTIYMAHGYHTKVPHPAIMRYILHYTQPGDIIYDGFAGTGMTGVAAYSCRKFNDEIHNKIEKEWVDSFGEKPKWGLRHSICGDLSPYASMISYNFNTPTNAVLFRKEMETIIEQINNECGWMYKTKNEKGVLADINFSVWSDVLVCPNCGEKMLFWKVALDRESKCLNDEPKCPRCNSVVSKEISNRLHETINYGGVLYNIVKDVPAYIVTSNRQQYNAGDYDAEIVNKVESIDIPYFYPCDQLPEGCKTTDPISSHNITHTHLFYTKRNLYALSSFLDKIEKSRIGNKLKFIFTGMINRSTKMNRFSPRNFFYGGGGWCLTGLSGTLYVPALPMEVSVLEQIKNKYRSYENLLPSLPSEYDGVVNVSSATSISIEDNSIDYIFTDPPFGANIMYSELNYIPESWLKVKTNIKDEAIVNSVQRKSIFEYQQLMNLSFREYFRILKPGKWITIEFSNTSAAVWNSIQNALQGVGFVVSNVSSLDKQQGSFNAVTSTTAVKQDLVITCYKPSDELTQKIAASSSKKDKVWDFIEEHLNHLPVHLEKGNRTTTVIERSPKILYDRLISYYVQHGYPIPMDAQEFQKGLAEHFIERDGMYFNAPQAAEYMEKRKNTTGYEPLGLIVSDEANGIEWLKIHLKEPKTYQQISPEWMQTIKGVKKGDVLPELIDILQENFIEDETGHWHVPDLEKQIDLEKIHHNKLMKQFNVYKEMAQMPRARIKEVRVEALREGFKQCFKDKDFPTILLIGDKIPQNILTEDEVLLQYYDIAQMRS